MTAEPQENSEITSLTDQLSIEQLPPVEPPSAKFIVQLFVVPGLIVAAIVGAWLLFGKLASAEQDWQKLVQDLKSGNEHRRGRAAYGLANALAAEKRSNAPGPKLATNPQVAQELSSFLAETLKGSADDKAIVEQEKYLIAAVGELDVTEPVLAVLREAMQSKQNAEVRQFALRSVANVAFRAADRGERISSAEALEEVVNASRDENPLMRSVAAYTLAFFPFDSAQQPLTVLLADADINARANAAIALARNKSLDGLPVLRDILNSAVETKTAPTPGDAAPIAVSNVMKAVAELQSQIEASERDELARKIEQISKNYPMQRVRMDAMQTLSKLHP